MTEIQKYQLENLDCANCAAKIEAGVQEMPGVRFARVNFATSSIHIDADNLNDVKVKIRQMEPQVVLRSVQEPNSTIEPSSFRHLILISASLLLFISGLSFYAWLESQGGAWLVFGAAYLLSGFGVLRRAVQNIRRGNWFDETFLMSISTLGAIAIGEMPEAVGVMLFYQIGEFLQQLSVNRSRRMIQSLMDVQPDSANLLQDSEREVQVNPEDVAVGDLILVRPGERIPLDGQVVEGSAQIDTSMLTGESIPITSTQGSDVFAGTVNLNGVIKVLVSKSVTESSVSRMLNLVESAANRKAKTELFITRFAKIYSPIMVLIALLVAFIPPLLLPDENLKTWIYRALVVLVISCPCALVISIPLGYFGGIGGASRRGILVKGANFLDVLADVRTVVFDKTGTLTRGEFKVSEISPVDGFSPQELLKLAVYAETHSTHPVASSIREAYQHSTGHEFAANREVIAEYEELAGYGVRAKVNGDIVVVGNDAFLHLESIPHQTCDVPGTVVHVAKNQEYMGYLVVSDDLKEDSIAAVEDLHAIGVDRVVMLSGDHESVVGRVAKLVGLDEYKSGLLPNEKVEALEQILQNHTHGKLAFVGDGINDAPALARADVGIAMGAFGTDAAKETADVVLMTDSIAQVAKAIGIGRRTRRIVLQNIGIALGIKAIFIVLGVTGAASMWEAVFADVGVTVLAVLNSSRILR